jgi:hypothetical protein
MGGIAFDLSVELLSHCGDNPLAHPGRARIGLGIEANTVVGD